MYFPISRMTIKHPILALTLAATSLLTMSALAATSTSTSLFQVARRPSITKLEPSRGPTGTQVTIVGRGFMQEGNTVYFDDSILTNVPSKDGKRMTFTVPNSTYRDCLFLPRPCLMPQKLYTPGRYAVTVETHAGRSNRKVFVITAAPTADSAEDDSCKAYCPDGYPFNKCVMYIQDPCNGHYGSSSSISDDSCKAYCPDGTIYNTCAMGPRNPCLGHEQVK